MTTSNGVSSFLTSSSSANVFILWTGNSGTLHLSSESFRLNQWVKRGESETNAVWREELKLFHIHFSVKTQGRPMTRIQKAKGHSSILDTYVRHCLRLWGTRQEQEDVKVQEVENYVHIFGSILDNVACGSNRWLKAEVLASRWWNIKAFSGTYVKCIQHKLNICQSVGLNTQSLCYSLIFLSHASEWFGLNSSLCSSLGWLQMSGVITHISPGGSHQSFTTVPFSLSRDFLGSYFLTVSFSLCLGFISKI